MSVLFVCWSGRSSKRKVASRSPSRLGASTNCRCVRRDACKDGSNRSGVYVCWLNTAVTKCGFGVWNIGKRNDLLGKTIERVSLSSNLDKFLVEFSLWCISFCARAWPIAQANRFERQSARQRPASHCAKESKLKSSWFWAYKTGWEDRRLLSSKMILRREIRRIQKLEIFSSELVGSGRVSTADREEGADKNEVIMN